MISEKDFNHILTIYKEKRFKILSDNMITVDSNDVHQMIRKGANLLTCTCFNHTQNADSPAFCRHKLFFILFPYLDRLENKLKELEGFYGVAVSIERDQDMKRKQRIFLDHLDEIRRLRL